MFKKKISFCTKTIVFIMFFMMTTVIYQIVIKNVVVDLFGIKNTFVEKTISSVDDRSIYEPEDIVIDWESVYGYPSNPKYDQKVLKDKKNKSNDVSIIDKIYDQFDKYCSEYFSFKKVCKIISKAINKELHMNLINDAYKNLTFELRDGRWMSERKYADISDYAYNTIIFSEWCDNNNIKFVYINTPSPVDPEEENIYISGGYEEYSNQMANEFINYIENAGVKVLDIREEAKNAKIRWSDMIMKGDHHWKSRYGFWAASIISKEINKNIDCEVDEEIFDISNWTIVEDGYNEGSFYNVATAVNVEKDLMEWFYPKFETQMQIQIPTKKIEKTGSFKECIYNNYKYPSYNTWNYGITALKQYSSQNAITKEKKILLLTDSYSDVVSPFLELAYSNVDEIDLRCFTGSLETYITNNPPDIVCAIYTTYLFNNGCELWEFR